MTLYFEVFLLISFIAHKKNGQHQSKALVLRDADLPSATIIVPCYNEEKTLAGTLDSLLALDYPTEKLRVIVVNDGSVDKTPEIAHKFAADHASITALDKENGGKASAMNMAIKHCDTELVGCLDADSFVDSGALMLIAKQFINNPEVSAVTPAIMIHDPNTVLQMMQRAEYMAGVFMRRVFSMIDSIIVTPGPFSIFRRADIIALAIDKDTVWLHAHGTEDFEMGLRLQSQHKKIANEPLAKVMTISPNTLYSLYRQRIRWMYGFLMNAWDYKYMIGNIKYGNIGMLILPTTLLSMFGGVYLFWLFLLNVATAAVDLLVRLYTTGITLGVPNIDFFYINISALILIALVLAGLILVILHNSAKMSETRVYKKDTAIYILLYGLIAPLWLTGAVARAAVGAEAKWRVIR